MTALPLIHLLAFASNCFAIFYDLSYVKWHPSFNMENTFIPLKGRLKFLTFWNMKMVKNLLLYLMYFGILFRLDKVPQLPQPWGKPDWHPLAQGSQFLTFWTLVLQTVYFGVAVLNDLFGSNENIVKNPPLIRRMKDYLFSVLAFPTAMYVGITFWSLMAIDRELVFPKILDEFFPTWLNHVMHTNIMIFILIELVFTCRAYPPRKTALFGVLTFFASYLTWVHIIYYKTDTWVYPVLTFLNWYQRLGFFAVSILFGLVLFFAGEFLNNKIWAKQLTASERSGRKKIN